MHFAGMSVYILKRIILSLVLFVWAISIGPAAWAADLRAEEIITVLPKDGIPAILSPSFEDGNTVSWLKGKDAVIGVSIKGDSRAYSVAILSRREIVNDRVGGVPIAVTW